MIKLVTDTINKDDINSLIEWLSQDEIPQLTKGPLTIELEKKWAKKIGTKHSVFVNSGSSAIYTQGTDLCNNASPKIISSCFSPDERYFNGNFFPD